MLRFTLSPPHFSLPHSHITPAYPHLLFLPPCYTILQYWWPYPPPFLSAHPHFPFAPPCYATLYTWVHYGLHPLLISLFLTLTSLLPTLTFLSHTLAILYYTYYTRLCYARLYYALFSALLLSHLPAVPYYKWLCFAIHHV